jgi:hypothetical protein
MHSGRRLAFSVGGAIIAVPLIFMVAVLMGGGHGTYLPAIFFFPYAMLLAILVTNHISPICVAFAVLQYPVYGLALAYSSKKRASLIFAMHFALVVLALLLKPGSFID